MSKCVDPDIGILLHAYELNALSEEERIRFESHLFDCDHCFNEVRSYEQEAALLRSHKGVRRLVSEAVSKEFSWIHIVWGKLSPPEAVWVLKPIFLWILILLMAVPTYHGLIKPGEVAITGTSWTHVGGDLSGGHSLVKLEPGIQHYLTFDIPESLDCHICNLVIETLGGEPILHVEDFASIHRLRIGMIELPDIPPGIYKIIITDPQTERRATIHFRVYIE
jgi:hypothetical protein